MRNYEKLWEIMYVSIHHIFKGGAHYHQPEQGGTQC